MYNRYVDTKAGSSLYRPMYACWLSFIDCVVQCCSQWCCCWWCMERGMWREAFHLPLWSLETPVSLQPTPHLYTWLVSSVLSYPWVVLARLSVGGALRGVGDTLHWLAILQVLPNLNVYHHDFMFTLKNERDIWLYVYSVCRIQGPVIEIFSKAH